MIAEEREGKGEMGAVDLVEAAGWFFGKKGGRAKRRIKRANSGSRSRWGQKAQFRSCAPPAGLLVGRSRMLEESSGKLDKQK